MISSPDVAIKECMLDAIVGKLTLQKKLKHISENCSDNGNPELITPILKYHTKNSPSVQSSYTGRCATVLQSGKTEQTEGLTLPLHSYPQQPSQTVLTPNTFPAALSSHDLNYPANNFISSSIATYGINSLIPSLSSPRLGPTGSLVTPARLKHKLEQQRGIMPTDSTGTVKLHKSNSIESKVFPLKSSFSSQSSQYTANVSKTLSYQNWSNSVLPQHNRFRPSSARQVGSNNSKATNTVDSFLSSKTSQFKPVLPSKSCIALSSTLKASHRPKSSSSRKISTTAIRPSQSFIHVSEKDSILPDSNFLATNSRRSSKPSLEDFVVTNHNSATDNSMNSSKGKFAGISNKLKMVTHESHLKQKSKSNKQKSFRQEKLKDTRDISDGVSSTSNSMPHLVNITPSQRTLPSSNGTTLKNIDASCKEGLPDRVANHSGNPASLRIQQQAKGDTSKNLHVKSKKIKSSKSRKLHSDPIATVQQVNNLENTSNKLQQLTIDSQQVPDEKSTDEMIQNLNLTKETFKSVLFSSNLISDASRKNSNDSGNGTLSNQSVRCCGDGAEENLEFLHKYSAEAKQRGLMRQPGDGEDDLLIEEDDDYKSQDESNYEESYTGSNSCLEVDGNDMEFMDELGSCQGSDVGINECFPYDDVLDCVDDSAVASLDEDYAPSETVESECSGVDAFYLSPQKDDKIENRKPAVLKSMFSNCLPVINFVTHTEQVEPLPPNIRKLLKWKMSTITPIVVRNTVMRSGFKSSKKNHDWLGYFGKHMKSNGFRSLRDYQKMNHFPGSFQLGRKDRLWRNISRMQTRFGKKEFGFVPQSYVLPWDRKLLKNAWEEGSSKQKYILKPPASARGIGIRVIHKWNQIPMKKPIMVQKYLSRPYLINGNKFDLRLYVHVTSFDPLRIYLFEDGLVRFATCKYSSSMKHLSNKYMHLTNYSINKKSGVFEQNNDASICQGHKWSLKALWGFMQQSGIDTDKIWNQMKDIVIKTILSVEQCTNSLIKSNCRRPYCCHELFGFDVMLDDKLRPWLLEVNISPSLHSNSPLDVEIKGPMVKDMFNLCGFLLPDKKQITGNAPSSNPACSVPSAAASFSQDKRKQGHEVTTDTRVKHTYFAQHYKHMDEQSMSSLLLDVLTVNDIRVLVESENELYRKGGFERIFPTTTRKYLHFFEQPRYYNELLHVWEAKYAHQRSKAVLLLESYCRRGLHLPEVTVDPSNIPAENVWNPALMSQPKIMPSPRVDAKPQQTTLKQATSVPGPVIHAPSVVTTTLPSYLGRPKSAKIRRNRITEAEESHSSMMINKPMLTVASVKGTT